MTTNQLASEIRQLLLESPHVDEVLQVSTAGEADAVRLVGIRVSIVEPPQTSDLPPVLAGLRASVRSLLPGEVSVFIEPDLTGRRRERLTTEAVVIRSAD